MNTTTITLLAQTTANADVVTLTSQHLHTSPVQELLLEQLILEQETFLL